MFSFDSKTDEQIADIQNRKLLTDGIYPFIVKTYEPRISKTGNSMLEIMVGVLDSEGNERNIKDFLLATDTMIFKLKHFCEAIGMHKEYAAGRFDPAKCLGRTGKCVIGLQKGNEKPDGTGYYPDRNSIKDYVKAEMVEDKPPFDDDIKF
jgi:hypothetical protein